MIPFSQKTFFKFGAFCFIVIALANLWGLWLLWDTYIVPFKIARVASVVFNFGLAYFFFYLMKITPDFGGTQMQPQNIEEMFKESEK